ncbi:MAG: neutral/alkaline non-lysosomal ceramidase N-terminal domain-containing protein [Bryobacterales bacterium]|nr:neutral/alkaline non-lysosomal ceramidase N-terminal domain-containing protein [Bryobacterales bacterium]
MLLTAMLLTLFLQAQPKPDLTGEWRLLNARSNFDGEPAPASKLLQFDHRDPTLRLTITEAPSANAAPMDATLFYSTDNAERVNLVLGNEVKARTRWDGSAIVQTSEGAFNNNQIKLTDRYELSPDRQTLTLHRHFEGTSPRGALPTRNQVLVFERVTLQAGVAKVDITPTVLLAMYGYSNRRCGDANGTHDPLMAKALVLQSGASKLAIVTHDLGSMVSDNLRQRLTRELGITAVLLSASHTHSGPFFLTRDNATLPEPAQAYRAELDRKVFEAVQSAAASMFPARLRTGTGEAPLGYNRLTRREHGRSRAEFNNPDRVPYGPFDPEFRLLEITDTAGNPKALLVHYGVHSVVLGPTNCKYSADYPGALQAAIEKAVPGIQAMFVQGGAGDINPIFMGRSGNEEADFQLVDKLGNMLAAEVLKARARMRPIDTDSLPIRTRGETLRFQNRWQKDRSHEIGITTVLIGRDIAIAAMPGEPHSLFQKQWRERADVAFPLFYGYTFSSGGEWPGYLPDLKSAAYGGYGSDSTSTNVEVGAGERLLERHLFHLYDLKGMWLPKPGQN